MEELTAAFLLLARESETGLPTETVCINDVVATELERALPLAEGRPVALQTRSPLLPVDQCSRKGAVGAARQPAAQRRRVHERGTGPRRDPCRRGRDRGHGCRPACRAHSRHGVNRSCAAPQDDPATASGSRSYGACPTGLAGPSSSRARPESGRGSGSRSLGHRRRHSRASRATGIRPSACRTAPAARSRRALRYRTPGPASSRESSPSPLP